MNWGGSGIRRHGRNLWRPMGFEERRAIQGHGGNPKKKISSGYIAIGIWHR